MPKLPLLVSMFLKIWKYVQRNFRRVKIFPKKINSTKHIFHKIQLKFALMDLIFAPEMPLFESQTELIRFVETSSRNSLEFSQSEILLNRYVLRRLDEEIEEK